MSNLIILNEGINYGKAIQVYLDKVPYLIVGDESCWKHPGMLKKFLLDNDIPFEESWLYGNNFGPLALGKGEYKLAGAGWADLWYADKIMLSGQSDSYRMSPNERHAKEISDLLDRKVELKKSEPIVMEERYEPSTNWEDEIPF